MSNELIPYIKLIHAAYNTAIISLFIYQGFLGWRIRKSRSKLNSIEKHRKTGPIAVVLAIIGFFGGVVVVYLDKGRFFVYPIHFLLGLALVSLIVSTYIISKKIKGSESYWRNKHYIIGIVIVLLYFVQAFLGLGILL